MNKIFVISGPSGVGKGTIVKRLLEEPSLNLNWSKSYTTRGERPSDKQEGHYFFVDRKKFIELQAKGEILETNFYNGNWYGTSKSEIDKALADGHNIIKEVEINGALKYRNLYPDTILIFIKANEDELKLRLIRRGQNTSEQIEERLNIAKRELLAEKDYDYSVVNPEGHPEIAIAKIEAILKKEIST